MLKLLGQRLVLGFLTLIVVSALIFAVTEWLPGDIATNILGQSATPENVAAIRAELGRGTWAPRWPTSGRSRLSSARACGTPCS